MSAITKTRPRGTRPLAKVVPLAPDWALLYELLKSRYAASATNSTEYESACRRAAREAGV